MEVLAGLGFSFQKTYTLQRAYLLDIFLNAPFIMLLAQNQFSPTRFHHTKRLLVGIFSKMNSEEKKVFKKKRQDPGQTNKNTELKNI